MYLSQSDMALFPPVPDLETPWSTQPIAWRYVDKEMRAEAIRRQVAAGLDFVVREVIVHKKRGRHSSSELSVSEIEDTVADANQEFCLLRKCGLVVPPVDWHIFTDEAGNNRVLARPPVIEGQVFPRKYRSEMNPYELSIYNAHKEIIHDYYHRHPPRFDRLADVFDIQQCMIGQFKPSELVGHTPSPALCLADIEPYF